MLWSLATACLFININDKIEEEEFTMRNSPLHRKDFYYSVKQTQQFQSVSKYFRDCKLQ